SPPAGASFRQHSERRRPCYKWRWLPLKSTSLESLYAFHNSPGRAVWCCLRQEHARRDNQNSSPSGHRNVLMQPKMSSKGDKHIGAGGNRQNVTEICTTEQSQIGSHPYDQNTHTHDCPRTDSMHVSK